MNKKGFTLIELLAVITLMALIAAISVPNVLKTLDNSKKEDYINDAKSLVATAKYKYNTEKGKELFDDSGCITIDNLNFKKETDAFGNNYDDKSKVCVYKDRSGELKYKVKLESGKKCLGVSSCGPVDYEDLTNDMVIDK